MQKHFFIIADRIALV
nr:NADH dehydrogenase subunit 1 [Helleborus argutifolius]WIW41792.1 NADH dehydrogenase subunit 1 [Helleborus argutifolius]